MFLFLTKGYIIGWQSLLDHFPYLGIHLSSRIDLQDDLQYRLKCTRLVFDCLRYRVFQDSNIRSEAKILVYGSDSNSPPVSLLDLDNLCQRRCYNVCSRLLRPGIELSTLWAKSLDYFKQRFYPLAMCTWGRSVQQLKRYEYNNKDKNKNPNNLNSVNSYNAD